MTHGTPGPGVAVLRIESSCDVDLATTWRDTMLSRSALHRQTSGMQSALTVWLVERLHVDLGRARTMICR